jgi:hypothetical protein
MSVKRDIKLSIVRNKQWYNPNYTQNYIKITNTKFTKE